MERHREKTAICEPRREVTEEHKPANTSVSGFWPQNHEEMHLRPVSHPVGDPVFQHLANYHLGKPTSAA